jgi:hypothetical protein
MTEHVARRGEKKNVYKIVFGNLKGRGYAEDLGADGRIILEWIFENRVGRFGLDASGSG